MNRDELVEKVARAVQQHGVDIGVDSRTWEQIPEFAREQYRDDARIAVDILLPQVTVAELQALPPRALVLKDFVTYAQTETAESLSRVVLLLGEDFLPERPMTVVWQP